MLRLARLQSFVKLVLLGHTRTHDGVYDDQCKYEHSRQCPFPADVQHGAIAVLISVWGCAGDEPCQDGLELSPGGLCISGKKLFKK